MELFVMEYFTVNEEIGLDLEKYLIRLDSFLEAEYSSMAPSWFRKLSVLQEQSNHLRVNLRTLEQDESIPNRELSIKKVKAELELFRQTLVCAVAGYIEQHKYQ